MGPQRTQLTFGDSHSLPSWSPDGTRVLFTTDREGTPQMWMMNADGSDPHFVADSRPGPGPGDSAWQPLPDGDLP